MNEYACSKCHVKHRLVVWSRERGYLCAVCAGQAADEPCSRGPRVFLTETPREYGARVAEVDILATRRELEAKVRAELEAAPRSEMRRGYEGWRAPNDPRRL